METKEIQKLIDFISHSGLDEVSIETNELKISVKRFGNPPPMMVAQAPVLQAVAAAPAPSVAPVALAATPVAAPPKAEVSNLLTIKSPMIGTFYAASKPDSPPLADVGHEVSIGQPVCIIEAMKLFNEIESEVAGRIVKVLVTNNSPVEYDQPLFLVEPM
jgi:acetyl-CoA carboxylase biotin carboxyl carrier protein